MSGNVGTGEETYTREPTPSNRLEDMFAKQKQHNTGDRRAAWLTWQYSDKMMDELGEYVDDLIISKKKFGPNKRQLKELEKIVELAGALLSFGEKHSDMF